MSDLYLMGDEDGGVSLCCRHCRDGGRPLAYYDPSGSNPYADEAVVPVSTIEALVIAAQDHAQRTHGIADV